MKNKSVPLGVHAWPRGLVLSLYPQDISPYLQNLIYLNRLLWALVNVWKILGKEWVLSICSLPRRLSRLILRVNSDKHHSSTRIDSFFFVQIVLRFNVYFSLHTQCAWSSCGETAQMTGNDPGSSQGCVLWGELAVLAVRLTFLNKLIYGFIWLM